MKGYESIPPPIRDQLNMLADGLGNVTTALGKVWDARKDGALLDRMDSKLETLAGYATEHQTMLHEFVMPAIKECMTAANSVAMQLPRLLAQIEGLTLALGNLDRQVRMMELENRSSKERAESEHRALESRVARTEIARNEHDTRIELLERENRDREVIAKANAKKERHKSGAVGSAAGVAAVAVFEAIKIFL